MVVDEQIQQVIWRDPGSRAQQTLNNLQVKQAAIQSVGAVVIV